MTQQVSPTVASEPEGELVMRTMAMPSDTNANGDIFGGWIISQMDLGAGIIGKQRAQSRVVTVAINAMSFLNPVHVGDVVSCYAKLLKVGRTSLTIKIETWTAKAEHHGTLVKVTEGVFTFVAIDDYGNVWPVDRN